MKINPDLKYTASHEWVRVEENAAYMGISDFAQEKLGSLVFLELPEPGDEFTKGDPLVTAESVKAASDVYTPLSGTVTEINEGLLDDPGQVNKEPYASWLVSVEISNPEELKDLMNAEEYEEFCRQEE